MKCPTVENLERLARRELDDGEASQIESHVEECESCRELLESVARETVAMSVVGGVDETATYVSEDGARSDSSVPDFGRYPARNFLAKGALGEVYAATDTELNREVAVKSMIPRLRDRENLRDRFFLEAQVTGRLEHPGVVPVYGCGKTSGGSPYYAMRLIRGESLKKAILRLHGDASSDHTLRGLLTRFTSVCNAIAYAHSRHVVHRDLKPANVMLGPFGETLVVDWGLAKELDELEKKSGEPRAAAEGERGTLAGQVVGTPAYMSPEQAKGNLDVVGPASDVYSLGAMLFEIATGELPYRGTVAQVLAAVADNNEPPQAWQRNSACGKSLSAICAKAMAKQPADRYPNALALAEDVERWLGDEPIAIYRDPVSVRLARWGRRNRTLVSALATLCLTAIFALGVGVWAVNGERIATAAERDAKELARRQAKNALDTLTDDVIERLFARQTELTQDDRRFLRNVLHLYEDLASADGANEESLANAADGHFRVSQIHFHLDDVSLSREACLEAKARYEQLIDRNPEAPQYKLRLADARRQLGSLQEAEGEFSGALRELEQARDLYLAVARSDTGVSGDLADAANCVSNIGVLWEKQGVLDKATVAQSEARDLMSEALDNAGENKVELGSYLAEIENNLGILFHIQQDLPKAEQSHRQAEAVMRDILAKSGNSPTYRHDLASTLTNLGAALLAMDRGGEAIETHESAKAIFDELQSEFPFKQAYRDGTASSSLNAADAHKAMEQYDEADDLYQVAIDAFDRLVELSPSTPEYQFKLVNSLWSRGDLKMTLGEHREASTLFDAAMRHFEASETVDEGNPYRPILHHELLKSVSNNHIALAEHRAAAQAAETLVTVGLDPSTEHLFAAKRLAECIALANSDDQLDQTTQKSLCDAWAKNAIRFLQLAFDNGLEDRAVLEDRAFDSIRDREDFPTP